MRSLTLFQRPLFRACYTSRLKDAAKGWFWDAPERLTPFFVPLFVVANLMWSSYRCILAGGLSPEGRDAVLSILEEEQDLEGRRGGEEPSIPLVLFTPGIADERVGDVLSNAAAISSQQARPNCLARE